MLSLLTSANRFDADDLDDLDDSAEFGTPKKRSGGGVLAFTAKAFPKCCEWLLCCSVIGCAVIGLVSGARADGGSGTGFLLGLLIGVVVGLVSMIMFGGMTARFIIMGDDIKKIEANTAKTLSILRENTAAAPQCKTTPGNSGNA